MNRELYARLLRLWDASARIIAGLYRLLQAKTLLRHLRHDRSARAIASAYRHSRERVEAKRELAWRRNKRRAAELARRTKNKRLCLIWRGWQCAVDSSRHQRQLIAQRVAAGVANWLRAQVQRLVDWWRRCLAERERLTLSVLPTIDPLVLNMMQHAVASVDGVMDDLSRRRHSFLLFRDELVTELTRWRAPSVHEYELAKRYDQPLDDLPLGEIWAWVATLSGLDLFQPFTARTLRILSELSQFYSLHNRVDVQVSRVWSIFEATMTMRDYLALLYEHDMVAWQPASTFLFQQRQRAAAKLQAANNNDQALVALTGNHRGFTSFHCLWSGDLCERCLMLQPKTTRPRECACCGHRHSQRATEATKAVSRPWTSGSSNQRVADIERCDLLVVHAFLHALAPANHANRAEFPIETLWKLAVTQASAPVGLLYRQESIATLDDLLSARVRLQDCSFLPAPVLAKLELFAAVLTAELDRSDCMLLPQRQL